MKKDTAKNLSDWTQIVVFQGLLLNSKDIPDFEEFCEDQLGARMSYLDTYETLSDVRDGKAVAGTGGRHDVMVRIHPDDIGKYAPARLAHGDWTGRWWEDVVDNNRDIIPDDFLDKYPKTW